MTVARCVRIVVSVLVGTGLSIAEPGPAEARQAGSQERDIGGVVQGDAGSGYGGVWVRISPRASARSS